MRDETPSAHLFGNGNAMFFDEEGEQIVEMQQHGLAGVHLFKEEYPAAPIYWSIWGRAQSDIHENVFDYIKTPEEMSDG